MRHTCTMPLSFKHYAFLASLLVHVAAVLALLYSAPVLKIHASLRSSASVPAFQFRIEKPMPSIIHEDSKQQEADPVIKPAPLPDKHIAVTSTSDSPPLPAAIPVVKDGKLKGSRTPPFYPKRALQLRQQGTTLVHALVSETGTTEQVIVFQSSGYPLLDKEAINAVQKWRFSGTVQSGKAIKSWIEIPVEFVIK